MAKCLSLNKFVSRYAVREIFKNEKGETETAIYLTDKKTFCTESEQYKFYVKIGGVLNLQDLNTQKVKDLLGKLDTSGFYMIMTNHRTTKGPNTFALICPKVSPKTLEIPYSPLVSFLPRIDGQSGDVFCGLRIDDDRTKARSWTRFVGSTKSIPNGFHELKFGYTFDDDYKSKSRAKYVGFYVNKYTSLVIYDIGTIDPNKAVNPEQNRTLIQEGGFVYADVDLLFRVCSEPEDKLYSAKELYEKFKDIEKSVLGSDRYKKSHFIRDNKEPKQRSVIFFLKPTPCLLPYELHITDDLSKESLFRGKRTAVLTIPSGGEFEYAEFWQLKDGIESVVKRQRPQPWNKYLQKESDAQSMSFEVKINDIPIMSYPSHDKNEKTPQSDELFKKIRKARKELLGGKGAKEPKTDSLKNKTPNETKPTPEDANKPKQETEEQKKQSVEPKNPENSGQQSSKDEAQPPPTPSTPPPPPTPSAPPTPPEPPTPPTEDDKP